MILVVAQQVIGRDIDFECASYDHYMFLKYFLFFCLILFDVVTFFRLISFEHRTVGKVVYEYDGNRFSGRIVYCHLHQENMSVQ